MSLSRLITKDGFCGKDVSFRWTCGLFVCFEYRVTSYRSGDVIVLSFSNEVLCVLIWKSFCSAVFLCLSGLLKRLTRIQTLRTLISGEEGTVSIYHLALIHSRFSKVELPCNATQISCVLSETTSSIFLERPLWFVSASLIHFLFHFRTCVFDSLCFSTLVGGLSLHCFFFFFRKSKWEWDLQENCVTLRTPSKRGHGSSQGLEPSSAMIR